MTGYPFFKKAVRNLSSAQQRNVASLIRLSSHFNSGANIQPEATPPEYDRPVVFESGHQPNFIPYPGIWKKVLLLELLSEKKGSDPYSPVLFFGFADQNLATAKILYENKIPALNKQGSKKIGFKIKESDRWKIFCSIEKPPHDIWDQKIQELRQFYLDQCNRIGRDTSQAISRRLATLTEVMEDCYKRAGSMSDLNAFIFARICTDYLGFNVCFFRYSDIHREGLFIEEFKKIARDLPAYCETYNTAAVTADLPPVSPGFFPFWYHCGCGGKVALMKTAHSCEGTCPVCGKNYQLPYSSEDDFFSRYRKDLDLSAVARNIIFSEGLGTGLFISGTGGSLRYGKIADAISRKLMLNIPLTVSWKSRDYYLGVTHRTALKETMKLFSLSAGDLSSGNLQEKLRGYQNYLGDQIRSIEGQADNKKELARYSGLQRSTVTQISMVKQTFSTIPSMLDLLVNFDARELVDQWESAVRSAELSDHGDMVHLQKNIIYPPGNEFGENPETIPSIYNLIASIIET